MIHNIVYLYKKLTWLTDVPLEMVTHIKTNLEVSDWPYKNHVSYFRSQLLGWNKVTFYQAHNRVLFSNGHDLMIKWRNWPPAYLQPALITANTLPPSSARTFVLTLCKFCKRAGSMLIMTLFVIWTLQQQSELAFFSGVWSELLLRTNGNIFRCPERAGGG